MLAVCWGIEPAATSTRREGKTIYYNLASEDARVIIGAVYEVFCKTKEPPCN